VALPAPKRGCERGRENGMREWDVTQALVHGVTLPAPAEGGDKGVRGRERGCERGCEKWREKGRENYTPQLRGVQDDTIR
jgi:hypothetical protein